ncbi:MULTISPECIES: hypothetical protein [unclassified Streptomyces]
MLIPRPRPGGPRPEHARLRDTHPDQPVDTPCPLYTAPEKS